MFKIVQQAYNQIMKERESGYSGSYGAYGNSTGSQSSGRYRYDGDYQNEIMAIHMAILVHFGALDRLVLAEGMQNLLAMMKMADIFKQPLII